MIGSDLFARGNLKNSDEFILVGQIPASTLQISPSNAILNYYFVDNNSVLDWSFSSLNSPPPVPLKYSISPTSITMRRSSDDVPLCQHNDSLVFSSVLTPLNLQVASHKNLPTSKLYAGAWYSWNLINVKFSVPTTGNTLIGNGSNGYFDNDGNTSQYLVNGSLNVGALPTTYYQIDTTQGDDIFSLYFTWISDPERYINPSVASWISSSTNPINIYSQPFVDAMLWYPYCDKGYSCGQCYGAVIVGGVACGQNTQVPTPSDPPLTNTEFPGVPFIPSGPVGQPGDKGDKGNPGPPGAQGAIGPMGYRGEDGKSSADSGWWTSSPALTFFGLLFLLASVLIYLFIFQ